MGTIFSASDRMAEEIVKGFRPSSFSDEPNNNVTVPDRCPRRKTTSEKYVSECPISMSSDFNYANMVNNFSYTFD